MRAFSSRAPLALSAMSLLPSLESGGPGAHRAGARALLG
jgi:hypothetical protein